VSAGCGVQGGRGVWWGSKKREEGGQRARMMARKITTAHSESSTLPPFSLRPSFGLTSTIQQKLEIAQPSLDTHQSVPPAIRTGERALVPGHRCKTRRYPYPFPISACLGYRPRYVCWTWFERRRTRTGAYYWRLKNRPLGDRFRDKEG
jgi:hypothetical protein